MHAVEASRRDDCRLEVPAPSGLQAQRRPCPLPPAPPFVRVRGTDFVTVAWYTPVSPRGGDGESSSLSYQVSFSADGNSVARRGWKRCYEGTDEMCTILGLAPGRQYRVRVLALNSAGASGFSGVSFCSTAPGPPDAPSAPAAHAATSSSVVLKWTSPDHDGGSSVGRYRLEMRRLDIAQSTEGELAGAEFELVYEGRRPEYSSRGLQPGKTYECRVQAVNKFGEGVWSASSKFSTDWRADRDQPSALIDLEAPASHAPTVHSHDEGKPENASVAVIPVLLPPAPQLVRGSQSLKLRGEAPNKGSHCEVATSYTLQKFECMEGDLSHDTGEQSEPVSGSLWEGVYTGSDKESLVAGLEPDRPYSCRVLAHCEPGASLPSEITAVSTDAAEVDPIPYLTTLAPLSTAAQALLDSCSAGTSTESSVVITASPPPQPAAPKLSHTTGTSISVLCRAGDTGAIRGSEWEEDSRGGNVTHEFEMAGPTLGKAELIYTGPESWYEVKNLAPNCLQKFRVRATDWSLFSDVSISTAKAPSRQDFMLLSSNSWSLPARRLIATLGILLVLGAALCEAQPVCLHMFCGSC